MKGCLLVIIGATAKGRKELVGLADGIRAQSWKRRGLAIDPQTAVADGALGFWKAVDEVCPKTRAQRCWVHKTANVSNKPPKSLRAKTKSALQDIWMAQTRKAAETALDAFIETYGISTSGRVPDEKSRRVLRLLTTSPPSTGSGTHIRSYVPSLSRISVTRTNAVQHLGGMKSEKQPM